MAGDWIKLRKKLLRDGRVINMSRKCHATRVTIIGALVTLWCLADEYAEESGLLPGYSTDDIDREVDVLEFCAALPTDWMEVKEDGSIILPNYQEHNGVTAKNRALAASRKQRSRSGQLGHADVQKVSRKQRDKSVTREEKRREENNTPPNPPEGEPSGSALRNTDSIPGNLYTTEFLAAWHRWKQHNAQRGRALAPLTVNAQLQQLSEWGQELAIAAINNSITSNWLKLVPPEPKSERPQPAMTDEQRAEKVRAERAAFRASKGLPADGEKLFKPTE